MKLKSILKKIMVLGCTATMFTAMAIPGMTVRADAGSTSNYIFDSRTTGSLTIHKYNYNGTAAVTGTGNSGQTVPADAEPLAEVKYSYVKVADLKTDDTTTSGSVEVKYTATAAATTYLKLTEGTDYLQSDMQSALNNKKTALENATGLTEMTPTGTDGATSVSNLPLGLYLVVETAVPENVNQTTDPFLVSIPMTDSVEKTDGGTTWNYDVHIYPKNQTDVPTLAKYARQVEAAGVDNPAYAESCTASMGDTVEYILVSKLPKITTPTTDIKKYTFTDTLPAGMTYVGASADTVKISFYDTEADAKAHGSSNLTLTYGTDFTVTDSGKVRTIALTDAKKLDSNYSQKFMVVYYQATVDSSANAICGDTGNTNKATLDYGRTAGDTITSTNITDAATVYTYGISLTKKLTGVNGNSAEYKKVTFTLKNTSGEYFVKAAQDATSKIWYVNGVTKNEAEATAFTVEEDGSLKIQGLEADTYKLKEVKTATGYSLLKEEIIVAITSKTSTTTAVTGANPTVTVTKVADAAATVDEKPVTMQKSGDSENAIVPMTITNTKAFLLPQTGGLGAIVCTMFGAIVFAGAAIFLRKKS